MIYSAPRALALLRGGCGQPSALFREGQEEAIRHVVEGRGRLPERLANEYFRTHILAPVAGKISLLVVDEAHCISDWGHDFRPHYRLLERIMRSLPANMRLMATTATANQRVLDDLKQTLGPELQVSRGSLGRPSLTLQTLRLPGQAERRGPCC